MIEIDQSPIGRTPRSNPATYTQAFTLIRDWFAKLPESRERGYKPGRFSFNVKGGRCEACQGDGLKRIEMNFLPDVYVTCDVCRGRRYNHETLQVKYKGNSIADLLEMPIEDALKLLENIPQIKAKLATLVDVGLGYLHLGQSSTTLSGGEAQRIKLARELSRRQTGKTLYILDEPTTGLHFEDIRKLLDVLHSLVELGNTVVVIEHQLDVIKTADWIIDLGPEGGEKGGTVIAAGPPEEILRHPRSYTGQALRHFLDNGKPRDGIQAFRKSVGPLLTRAARNRRCESTGATSGAVLSFSTNEPLLHKPLDFDKLKTVPIDARGGKVQVPISQTIRWKRHRRSSRFAAETARRRFFPWRAQRPPSRAGAETGHSVGHGRTRGQVRARRYSARSDAARLGDWIRHERRSVHSRFRNCHCRADQ